MTKAWSYENKKAEDQMLLAVVGLSFQAPRRTFKSLFTRPKKCTLFFTRYLNTFTQQHPTLTHKPLEQGEDSCTTSEIKNLHSCKRLGR